MRDFPDPLYQRLKAIAEEQDWSLAEVMRKAAEHFVSRFPEHFQPRAAWKFPTLQCGGDFLTDPAAARPEADAIFKRSESRSSPPIPTYFEKVWNPL